MNHFADPDALAFADQDLLLEIASRPFDIGADIDRELVERFGLRSFMQLAWHTVEGEGTFQSNWHIDAIAEHLEAVSRGEITRLCINIPPRHMKSLSVAVMWPAWDWIKNPGRRFLFSSYAHNLSIRDSVKCRRVLSSPWFRSRWGDRFRLTSDQNTKVKFENDKGGYRLATSVDGQNTGEGGDIVAVDDPHNVRQAESPAERENTLTWWDESMSTRLNDARTGAFVVIQQRVNALDLVGHILAKKGTKPYTVLSLPAEYEPNHPQRWFRDPRKEVGELLWPARVGKAEIAELKAGLGTYAAAAQLQQRPAPREGGVFQRKWFSKVDREAPPDCQWSRAWDFAATEAKIVKSDPDYTATAKVGFSPSMGKWYIGEIQRWRADPDVVRSLVLSLARMDGRSCRQTVPQDPGQAGKSQAADLVRLLAGWDVTAEPQSGSKMQRALPFAAQAGAGHIVLVAGDWHEDFLTEITGFPTGAHDDQIDAVASAFNALTNGFTGLLEFYKGRLAEQEAKPDRRIPVGIESNTVTTNDLGKAWVELHKARGD